MLKSIAITTSRLSSINSSFIFRYWTRAPKIVADFVNVQSQSVINSETSSYRGKIGPNLSQSAILKYTLNLVSAGSE